MRYAPPSPVLRPLAVHPIVTATGARQAQNGAWKSTVADQSYLDALLHAHSACMRAAQQFPDLVAQLEESMIRRRIGRCMMGTLRHVDVVELLLARQRPAHSHTAEGTSAAPVTPSPIDRHETILRTASLLLRDEAAAVKAAADIAGRLGFNNDEALLNSVDHECTFMQRRLGAAPGSNSRAALETTPAAAPLGRVSDHGQWWRGRGA